MVSRWIESATGRLRLRSHIVLFRSLHLAITLVIFFHFFWIKRSRQLAKVPEGAPNAAWKRIVVRKQSPLERSVSPACIVA